MESLPLSTDAAPTEADLEALSDRVPLKLCCSSTQLAVRVEAPGSIRLQ